MPDGDLIAFNQIPLDLRVPGTYVEFDPSHAYAGLYVYPTRVLLIGQALTATGPDPVRLQRAEDAVALWGRGSTIAAMAAAFFANQQLLEVWGVGVADAIAGTAATGSIALGGAATAAGTLQVLIAGWRVRVGVAAGDLPAAVAAGLAAAINALPDLPLTAEVNGVDDTLVDLAARHKGLAGNSIDVRTGYWSDARVPAGLTVAITAMAGGAGDPDIAPVIAAVREEWYTDWVLGWHDAATLTAVTTELARRFGPIDQTEGVAYAAPDAAHADLLTLGGQQNSPHLVLLGATRCPTPPWARAAALAGLCAYYTTIDPARPLQTLEMGGVLAPAPADRLDYDARDALLRQGIATQVTGDGGAVRLESVITTYQANQAGFPDPAYRFLNQVKTLAWLRWDIRAFLGTRFPRHKLADNGSRAARAPFTVTPSLMHATLAARIRQWGDFGLVDNVERIVKGTVVQRDPNDDSRLNVLLPAEIMAQLRVTAVRIEFRT